MWLYTKRVFLSPYQILKELPLPRENARVGDFGAGSGQYALALAKRFGPEGAVYAFDAFAPNLDAMQKEAGAYGSPFYTLETNLNERIPVRDNLLNAAVVANTLYGISDKPRFVSELARVLEPDASVLVVEWAGSFRNMGPTEEQIIAPGEAAKLFTSAGFSVEEMLPAGTHHFAFIATNHTP